MGGLVTPSIGRCIGAIKAEQESDAARLCASCWGQYGLQLGGMIGGAES
jgi:hypothetical protein